MARAEALGAPWPGAIGVSGGGDSVALMLLLARWAAETARPAPVVLSVDHGLRPGSARDARQVVARAKALGLKARVLVWRGPKPGADVEAAARDARYRLMGDWCARNGIAGLYVAHTLEDQAETFLLRLARGSGVDGLSAMQAVGKFPLRDYGHISVVRPLLEFHRRDLRDFLASRDEHWIEDPMNADQDFARVRVRTAWPALEKIGLSPKRVANAAAHLARARAALENQTESFLAAHCRFEGDGASLDVKRLAALPDEVGLRALAAILMRVSGADYRPRFERLERLYDMLARRPLTAARTLHGCRIAPARRQDGEFGAHTVLITRETRRSARADGNKICRNPAEN